MSTPTRVHLAEWISAASLEAQGYKLVDEPVSSTVPSAAVLPRYLHIADRLLAQFEIRERPGTPEAEGTP